jgi:hypothetical protein
LEAIFKVRRLLQGEIIIDNLITYTNMKKAEFLQLVQIELDNIKEKATKEEIGNLNFGRFDHKNRYNCIYGQMTIYCDSNRSRELQVKTFLLLGSDISTEYLPFSRQSMEEGNYYTALEKYLYMVRSPQHKKVIKYLKSEINTIKL